jgi:hypothetical protein
MLIPFWFRTNKGLGYGVTARSQREATLLLRDLGYPVQGEDVVEVVANIRFADLDQNHVVPNVGLMPAIGVWYPRHNL